jgi:hypothetical protein
MAVANDLAIDVFLIVVFILCRHCEPLCGEAIHFTDISGLLRA